VSCRPDRVQIVLCGLGGQGIVFLSRVIAGAAIVEGREVLTAETHGMSQRGGAVEAHVKIGDFRSSLVRPGSADLALAVDGSRLDAARPWLRPDGICCVDATEVPAGVPAGVHSVDASGLAREMGFPQGRNLALLGFTTALAPVGLPDVDAILVALDALTSPANREQNRRAFERGRDLAASGARRE
jgi:indolepyruvate ferredoxin oxidoreductase beta subunit